MSHGTVSRCSVAVVGGGFSGAAVAYHLLQGAARGASVVLIEPAAEIGCGLAYATPSASHCLNVPAGRLGLDCEASFSRWLAAQGLAYTAADFVPRRWLGAYTGSELARVAAEASSRGVTFCVARETVVRIHRNRPPYRVELGDGSTWIADQVVLATGHLPPAAPLVGGAVAWGDPRMLRDPWRAASLPALPADSPVLLIGTGLTAVDVVSQLQDQGHTGTIHLLSRRGLLPQPHRANEARPPAGLSPLAALGEELSLRGMLRAIRGWASAAQAAGDDWRDVMASLRPLTTELWQRLCVRDRRQFLRHLQPFWDTHRHRLAPEINSRLRAAIDAGQVLVHAGRVVEITAERDGRLAVAWRPRGGASTATLVAARVVNCTGPTSRLANARDPLHSSLRDAGVLAADTLGLGLVVDIHLRPIDASGVPAEGLYYVGPMLKAQCWEAVAVPELRCHARGVAEHVLAAMWSKAPA